MIRSFAQRIAAYFATFFLVAMGALFALWFYGLPAIGLQGASDQRLAEATRMQELLADHQRAAIIASLIERRGDVLTVAENKSIAEQLTHYDQTNHELIQGNFERVFQRTQRAYPDRFQAMRLILPNGQIIASSDKSVIGQPFSDQDLLARASRPGAQEILTEFNDTQGKTLAIVRQVLAPDEEGYTNGKLAGLLFVLLESNALLLDQSLFAGSGTGMHRTAQLFDNEGGLITQFPAEAEPSKPLRFYSQVADGFEGSIIERDARGQELLVVYRHIPLGGSQGWTLRHSLVVEEALVQLQDDAQRLLVAGLLLMLLAMALICAPGATTQCAGQSCIQAGARRLFRSRTRVFFWRHRRNSRAVRCFQPHGRKYRTHA